jgi:sugar phosphate permease
MFAPGAAALAVSVLVLLFFKDSPESQGFPPVESGSKKKTAKPAEPAGAAGKLGTEKAALNVELVMSCSGDSAWPC